MGMSPPNRFNSAHSHFDGNAGQQSQGSRGTGHDSRTPRWEGASQGPQRPERVPGDKGKEGKFRRLFQISRSQPTEAGPSNLPPSPAPIAYPTPDRPLRASPPTHQDQHGWDELQLHHAIVASIAEEKLQQEMKKAEEVLLKEASAKSLLDVEAKYDGGLSDEERLQRALAISAQAGEPNQRGVNRTATSSSWNSLDAQYGSGVSSPSPRDSVLLSKSPELDATPVQAPVQELPATRSAHVRALSAEYRSEGAPPSRQGFVSSPYSPELDGTSVPAPVHELAATLSSNVHELSGDLPPPPPYDPADYERYPNRGGESF